MAETGTFSVVIPAYNAAASIDQTLDSVRRQSRHVHEVLVTNDGSTDQTEAVLAAYAARNPDFPLAVASQENRGIAAARNNGLFRATGDYVAFLDADDRWYTNKLERVSVALTSHPETDVVYHNELEVGKGRKGRVLDYGQFRGNPYLDLLLNRNRLSPSATVIRTELARSMGGFREDPAFNSAEDYEFWLRLARAKVRFLHLAEILGEYHLVPDAVTMKIEYHNGNVLNVMRHHLELFTKEASRPPEFFNRMLRKLEGRCAFVTGRGFYRVGESRQARHYYLSSLRYRPFWWKPYAALLQSLIR